jgi:hypothetical protein
MKQNKCELIKVGGEYEKCFVFKMCNNVQRIQILSHLFSFFVDEKPLISCNLCSPWEISKFLPNELKIHIQQPGAYLKPAEHNFCSSK